MTGVPFARLYDRVYSGKDYAAEAKAVLANYRRFAGGKPASILDVGCGTGSHAVQFAKAGIRVIGVDLDSDAIDVALRKAAVDRKLLLRFLHGTVHDAPRSRFDLTVALFNVVNYLPDLATVDEFLGGVALRLRKGGIFVFDCWNGVAALRDPPRSEHREYASGEDQIVLDIAAQMDAMSQQVVIDNRGSIQGPTGRRQRFAHSYVQHLWTPRILGELLATNGFELLAMTSFREPTKKATERDWKLTLTSRKVAPNGPR